MPAREDLKTPSGLRTNGSRATQVVPDAAGDKSVFTSRAEARAMPMPTFIEEKGSGTLRKNQRIGMNVTSHALAERVAYEFGYGFEACPERCVTWGEARSEPDVKALTEVGWHVERYATMCLFPGDEMAVKYIIVEVDGERREGIGIVIRITSAEWVPKGYMVFAIIAEYDSMQGWLEAKNPC